MWTDFSVSGLMWPLTGFAIVVTAFEALLCFFGWVLTSAAEA